MSVIYNVYCDESCHLEHDDHPAMVLGALWCPQEKAHEIAVRLREIKQRHGLGTGFEVKWTKVSPAKVQAYLDLIDYFFDDDDLHFRALIVPNKSRLKHVAFDGQDHDTWYYKMYFTMLKWLLSPDSHYRIYIDIKDTRGAQKVRKLHDVLCNNLLDFERAIVERVQLVRSHEIEHMQLADLLIGAVSYVSRELNNSPAKLALVQRVQQRSGYSLERSTLPKENKFNLFRWRAQEFTG
jgi:Protein of unknown function (DUF3800)